MEQQSSAPLHSPFTCDAFAPHVNEAFTVKFPDGMALDLVLVSATPAKLQPHDGRALGKSGFVRRDPFSLIFRGPQEYQLNQRIHSFSHPIMGEFDMNLVPIGPGETGWLYEAVFN